MAASSKHMGESEAGTQKRERGMFSLSPIPEQPLGANAAWSSVPYALQRTHTCSWPVGAMPWSAKASIQNQNRERKIRKSRIDQSKTITLGDFKLGLKFEPWFEPTEHRLKRCIISGRLRWVWKLQNLAAEQGFGVSPFYAQGRFWLFLPA